jgi:hypothetical protein
MKFMSRLDDILIATLEHVARVTGRKSVSLGQLYRLYGMNENTAALRRSAEKLKEFKFIDFPSVGKGPFFSKNLSTTPLGHEYAEMEFGENLANFLEQNGLGFQPADLSDENTELAIPDSSSPPIDSASWTGLISDQQLTEDRRSKLVSALKQVELDLSHTALSNAEKAQARAYITASITLSEMPEPPVDLIWEMITRAGTIAGIASLFVSAIALLKT